MYWPDTNTGVDIEPARKPVASMVRKYFTEGGAGQAPTVPGGDFFNQITNELLNAVTTAGLEPSKTEDDQLAQAIQLIADSASDSLRQEIAEGSGSLVGCVFSGSQGDLAGFIDKTEADVHNNFIAVSPNPRVKSVLLSAPREGVRAAELKTAFGYTALYPQGIAQDRQTGEWFVCYIVEGGSDVEVCWVDVYTSDFIYSGKTFGLRCRFPEGLLIGYVSGQRKIGHSGATSDTVLKVTNLPATASILDLQIIPVTMTSTVGCLTAMGSFGDLAAVMSPLANNAGGVKYGLTRMFSLQDILSSATPTAIGTVSLPSGIVGTGDPAGAALTPPKPQVTKPQGLAVGPDGLAVYSGYQWYASNVTIGEGHNPRVSQFTLSGVLRSSVSVRVDHLANAFAAAGIAAPLVEPEGCAYDNQGRLITATVVGFNFVLCAEGVTLPGKTSVDVPVSYVAANPAGTLGSAYMTRGLSDVNNATITDADQAADYCKFAGLSVLRFQLATDASFTVSGKTFTEGNVFVENLDGNFFFISIISNAGEYKFAASGSTPRTWTMKSQVQYGAPLTNPASLGSLVQRGVNGLGQDRYVVAAANSHTPMQFVNATNGIIGSVGMGAASTSYNTTSDERLKTPHGEMSDALSLVCQMVSSGAVQLAAFKSTPDDIRPMVLAQRMHPLYPWAVTPGSGEPGDEDFIPWQVDSSQLLPLIVLALSQLASK
ncbi:hypothetical protein [Aeromonas sp. R7-5]|uniref:hypothetical protein n=1 Tax=Aeromonas sp. R7-5 TaxID=3138477 RepID=UPI0034A1D01F